MSKNKIRNAHCTYYEGQTGLCKAKEFVKCNPVNCKLYTIDELSTILDLQEQLKNKEQEYKELKKEIKKWKHQADLGSDTTDKLAEKFQSKEQECEKLKTQILLLQTMEIEENKKLKQKITELNQECQNFINTQYHLKNELKKYKKAVHKYKVVLQDKIKQLYLSRREFLKEINSVPTRIACKGEEFKNALDKFNNAIQVINNEDKYKQAIDKIEEIASGTYYETEQTVKFKMQDIQDIINRTKEQE